MCYLSFPIDVVYVTCVTASRDFYGIVVKCSAPRTCESGLAEKGLIGFREGCTPTSGYLVVQLHPDNPVDVIPKTQVEEPARS
jgi:hypothetical protein